LLFSLLSKVCVTDSGVGIASELLPKVFDSGQEHRRDALDIETLAQLLDSAARQGRAQAS
jgi:hypothetical protein